MKIENLCIHCMKEKHSADEICPFCGSDPKSADIPPYHLQPFSILAGKYLLGMAIGEGGFGITYIGMDLNLEMRVAIKEYYPNGCAVRNCSESNTVLSYSNSAQEVFEKGREKFINEARLLAKCSNLSEIVSVKDFFRENHTAYIVMEYIEGITLKAYLKQNGDHIPAQKTLQMMKPVICSLSKVHDMNLIHRDISPDNIMICNNGSVKILDFGGARDYIFSNEKSLSIMLKPGYAPEEQYRTHGNQGPWTDVYALCATMYRCITGSVPPESLERAYQESLPPIRSISPDCPPAAASAIEKGMSIYPEDRFQSMQELYSALYESSQSFSDAPEPQKRSKRKGLKIFLVICLFVIAFILVMYLTHDQVLTINISAKTETTGFISQADIRSWSRGLT
jgi:serine/threonine protein kinase